MHCTFCGGLFRWERGRCPIDGSWLATGDDPMIGRALGQAPAYLIERVHADSEVGRVYLARAPEGTVHVEVLFGDLAVEPAFYEDFVRGAALGLDAGTTSTGLPFAVTAVADELRACVAGRPGRASAYGGHARSLRGAGRSGCRTAGPRRCRWIEPRG